MVAAQQQQQRNPTAPVAPSALEGLTQHISRSVIGSIKDALESTRASLLEEAKSALAEASSDIADKASIKLRLENPTFSKLGCRQQYEHKSKVLRAIKKASQAVSKGDTEASLSALAEGKSLCVWPTVRSRVGVSLPSTKKTSSQTIRTMKRQYPGQGAQ